MRLTILAASAIAALCLLASPATAAGPFASGCANGRCPAATRQATAGGDCATAATGAASAARPVRAVVGRVRDRIANRPHLLGRLRGGRR